MTSAPGERCFPETGECAAGRFLQFWDGNGGLAVFGLPVSEQRTEQGREGAFATQWFERERFEAHPENRAPYDVLLGRLGDEQRDWNGDGRFDQAQTIAAAAEGASAAASKTSGRNRIARRLMLTSSQAGDGR